MAAVVTSALRARCARTLHSLLLHPDIVEQVSASSSSSPARFDVLFRVASLRPDSDGSGSATSPSLNGAQALEDALLTYTSELMKRARQPASLVVTLRGSQPRLRLQRPSVELNAELANLVRVPCLSGSFSS